MEHWDAGALGLKCAFQELQAWNEAWSAEIPWMHWVCCTSDQTFNGGDLDFKFALGRSSSEMGRYG